MAGGALSRMHQAAVRLVRTRARARLTGSPARSHRDRGQRSARPGCSACPGGSSVAWRRCDRAPMPGSRGLRRAAGSCDRRRCLAAWPRSHAASPPGSPASSRLHADAYRTREDLVPRTEIAANGHHHLERSAPRGGKTCVEAREEPRLARVPKWLSDGVDLRRQPVPEAGEEARRSAQVHRAQPAELEPLDPSAGHADRPRQLLLRQPGAQPECARLATQLPSQVPRLLDPDGPDALPAGHARSVCTGAFCRLTAPLLPGCDWIAETSSGTHPGAARLLTGVRSALAGTFCDWRADTHPGGCRADAGERQPRPWAWRCTGDTAVTSGARGSEGGPRNAADRTHGHPAPIRDSMQATP